MNTVVSTHTRDDLRDALALRDRAAAQAETMQRALERATAHVEEIARALARASQTRAGAEDRNAQKTIEAIQQCREIPTPEHLAPLIEDETKANAAHRTAIVARDRLAGEASAAQARLERAHEDAQRCAIAVMDEHAQSLADQLLDLERQQLEILRQLWARGQLLVKGTPGPVPLSWGIRSAVLKFEHLLQRPDHASPADREGISEHERRIWRNYLDRLMQNADASPVG